ncbi:hypothetical protein [Parendozoicomonas sp. Alg238-R29]|uniref:hypothetical protein n=1 Tax=Parendozoicomonas sp. Alg238-R29 TaxID=2993446 RepID=UPI00248E4220|nr:hypothetical protein [Parendozoicomonas sp. Alg238-R29]
MAVSPSLLQRYRIEVKLLKLSLPIVGAQSAAATMSFAETMSFVDAMDPHGFWTGLVSALSASAIFNSYRLKNISSRAINQHQWKTCKCDSQIPSGIAA